jgi:hypothetical protein
MLQNIRPERVGVLVVHGVGEQRQFEHLEEVVRNIALALQADVKLKSVQVSVNVSKDAAYRAEHQTWKGEGVATAAIEVIDIDNKQTNLEFREVWWSDLDEPNSFKVFLDFWVWGLSLWSKPPYDDLSVGTAKDDMRLPGRRGEGEKEGILPDLDQSLQFLHSLYLFLVSFVILLLLPFLWILGRVLRSISGLEIRPDILVEYLGDIKLYQQDRRIGENLLIDLGKNPPRSSIRRRVISAYAEIALENYERWYILSHSLGTIVAFNGLMETQQALPNYLSQNLWQKWLGKYIDTTRSEKPLTEEEKAKMLPQRPSWLEDNHIIDRKDLFSKLKGFVTYGSPLSKFAVLWPSIVPLNKDEEVFRENFEWINIFDPTDPVSDFTRFFDSQRNPNLSPREVAYKAEKIHLLSHGEYLNFRAKRRNPLVRQVSKWILDGNKFHQPMIDENSFDELGWPTPKINNKDSFLISSYFGIGILIWFLLGLSISFFLSWIVPKSLEQIFNLLIEVQFNADALRSVFSQINPLLRNPLSYFMLATIIIFIVGVFVRLLGFNKNRVLPHRKM